MGYCQSHLCINYCLARQEKEPKTEFASRLSRIRKLLGFQRDILASKLHVSSQGLGNYERGDRTPDASVLQAYAREFNINLNWLVSGRGPVFLDDEEKTLKPPLINSDLLEKLANLAITTSHESNIKLSPVELCTIAAELYNDLQHILQHKDDHEEIEATLPILLLRLKRRLAGHNAN